MNTRQKAKKYKHLYETLSKQPLPVIFKEPHHIETLRYERAYPEELIANTCFMRGNSSNPLVMKDVTDFIASTSTPNATAYIQKDITRGLAEGLDKHIVYRMYYDPEMNMYHVCGEIKVVE